MNQRTFVVGVGITKFFKPGQENELDYPDFSSEAVNKALIDAKINYSQIQQAICGYVYGDSTSGQRALYKVGITGIPIFNVNNNCSTGTTAIYLGKQIIESGNADSILILGFEKMPLDIYKNPAKIGYTWTDRTSPVTKHVERLEQLLGKKSKIPIVEMFAGAGQEHMQKYGSKPEHFEKIAYKNHLHSVNNPNALFQQQYSIEEIRNSTQYMAPITKLQCSVNASGAACVILANEQFVIKNKLEDQAIEILGMGFKSDTEQTFNTNCQAIIGCHLTKQARIEAFKQAKLNPEDVNIVELHDCFSTNELLLYEALGLCKEGEGHLMVENQNNTYGGKYVVNPDGGLMSKGHPFGATGVGMCVEICLQLRDQAGKRQVPNAKVGLQQNYGLGSAALVAVYKKYEKINLKAKL